MTENNLPHTHNVDPRKPVRKNNNRYLSSAVGGILVLILFAVTANNFFPERNNTLSVPAFSDDLAMQYAQPWLDAQEKVTTSSSRYSKYNSAMAMQYAEPWLDAQKKVSEVSFRDSMAMLYAKPWLDSNETFDCLSSLELFHACRNGLMRGGK